jgi:hypothetical protein
MINISGDNVGFDFEAVAYIDPDVTINVHGLAEILVIVFSSNKADDMSCERHF